MEMLDVVDKNGNPTGEVVERSIAHSKGIMHRTSHVWILRKRDGAVEILLQQRSSDKDAFPGCYDISSAGHIPAGVDYIPSAIRELEEELGVTATKEEFIFCGDRSVDWDDVFHGVEFHDRQYSRVFCIWKDMDYEDFKLQEEEVDGILWMNFDECIEAVKNNTIKHCILVEELMMVKNAI